MVKKSTPRLPVQTFSSKVRMLIGRPKSSTAQPTFATQPREPHGTAGSDTLVHDLSSLDIPSWNKIIATLFSTSIKQSRSCNIDGMLFRRRIAHFLPNIRTVALPVAICRHPYHSLTLFAKWALRFSLSQQKGKQSQSK